MRIGLTYDLREEYLAAGYSEEATAEFDRPDTIAAIENALRELGHQTDRIGHIKQLVSRLAHGDRWGLVFNIAEGMFGRAREAQVPALLEAYEIPCTFADALLMAVCLDKDSTKTLVRSAGIPTPDSFLVRSPADIVRIKLPFPLFAKPVGEGTGKGVTTASKIANAAGLAATCNDLLSRFQQPVLVETFLPGREFTVGLLGTGDESTVLGTLEIVLRPQAEADVYSYVNKEKCEDLVEYPLVRPSDPTVAEAERLALAAWKSLGCRDGGRIDVRCDANGRPNFIEVNPLAGLHPQHSDLPMLATAVGMPYVELIRHLVDSATKRVPIRPLRSGMLA